MVSKLAVWQFYDFFFVWDVSAEHGFANSSSSKITFRKFCILDSFSIELTLAEVSYFHVDGSLHPEAYLGSLSSVLTTVVGEKFQAKNKNAPSIDWSLIFNSLSLNFCRKCS